MSLSILKTGAIAAAIVLATASASLAATWGVVTQNSPVRSNHYNASAVVNSVNFGQPVQIVNSWGNWYKIQIPGPDGWVRKNRVSINPAPPPPSPGPGVQFCFNGPFGYLCINQ